MIAALATALLVLATPHLPLPRPAGERAGVRGADPADPEQAGTAPPEPPSERAPDDAELLKDLELLEQLDLLRHLELFDDDRG